MGRRLTYREPTLRVLIEDHAKLIKFHGSIINISEINGRLLYRSKSEVVVSGGIKGLVINGHATQYSTLQISSDINVIEVGAKKYRGRMMAIHDSENNIKIINDLPLEEYLRGVVASEISKDAPLEALKAQAIAARTYALYHLIAAKGALYDLDLPQKTQAYQGIQGESPNSDKAVNDTRGWVLEYKGQLFPAFYHTLCGGSTLSATEIWPKLKESPSGIICHACKKSNNSFWTYEIKVSQFKRDLMNQGYLISHLNAIKLIRELNTQRIKAIRINEQDITSHELRKILGPNNIKSTIFWIESKGETLKFRGKGWGHGVGMCQKGVVQLANEGFSHLKILEYYYPKAKCVKK